MRTDFGGFNSMSLGDIRIEKDVAENGKGGRHFALRHFQLRWFRLMPWRTATPATTRDAKIHFHFTIVAPVAGVAGGNRNNGVVHVRARGGSVAARYGQHPQQPPAHTTIGIRPPQTTIPLPVTSLAFTYPFTTRDPNRKSSGPSTPASASPHRVSLNGCCEASQVGGRDPTSEGNYLRHATPHHHLCRYSEQRCQATIRPKGDITKGNQLTSSAHGSLTQPRLLARFDVWPQSLRNSQHFAFRFGCRRLGP